MHLLLTSKIIFRFLHSKNRLIGPLGIALSIVLKIMWLGFWSLFPFKKLELHFSRWVGSQNDIRDIVGAGHELANHGYGHQRIWDLTPLEFKEDISRAKKILEDIGGVKVNGYRAPSYSIGKRNVWALEVIAETGHTYSSSIYPGSHDQYGFSGAPRFTFRDKNTGLIEVPITTFKLLNRLIPASGGGFFRLYPYAITRTLIQRLNANNHATVFYFHPWEIDPGQPRQQNIGLKARFRHYLNLDRTESRLKRLLNDFSWGRMDEVHVNRENIPEFAID
jgi:polysaccharide deacetylase family protein (PEP-CTERM system associated)